MKNVEMGLPLFMSYNVNLENIRFCAASSFERRFYINQFHGQKTHALSSSAEQRSEL